MLTGMVNIAVFAAFHTCVGSPFVLIAEFKGVCGDQPLDVSRYGWQKRQETATSGKGILPFCSGIGELSPLIPLMRG